MTLTGADLLEALSEALDDLHQSTTTGAGSTTTLVDSTLAKFGDRANEEAFVRLTEDSAVAGNIWLVRRITRFVTDTLTLDSAVPQIIDTGKDYEIHRYDPRKKFRALDRARILAFPQVAKIVVDETLTSDGTNTQLAIPTSIRRGPAFVWSEEPLDPQIRWNLLTNPRLNSLDGWTASSTTASLYQRTANDFVIPRHEDYCTKLVGNGTYRQSLGSTLAAAAAGRRASVAAWVYSRYATPTVTVIDDSGTIITSNTHGGAGWQFLTGSATITGTNATTLTVSINTGTANAVFVERVWFGFVDAIKTDYPHPVRRRGTHRDEDEAFLRIRAAVPRGYQYRLEGRTPVTALGETAATQVTNTMEVSETDQDLIIYTAMRILLTWEGMGTGEMEARYPEIAAAEARFKELEEDWKRRYPQSGYLDSSWIK
jgi:hypothetical protein